MTNPREIYPAGVSCFIDTERTDVDAAMAFYAGLFGWSYKDVAPEGAPRFALAQIDGLDVAGIGAASNGAAAAWNTYISVANADEVVAKVEAAGGRTLLAPFDVGEAGRMAIFADPEGAVFRVWQAYEAGGSELVNAPGSWNWSDLETRDIDAAKTFYSAVFGWEYMDIDFGAGAATMISVPGYGDHLEALNPGTLARHKEAGAPDGFSDAIGWMQPPANPDSPARWAVTFSVADADDAAARTAELGGTILVDPFDIPYSRSTVIRDPDGATLTLSQFKPPA
jgi:predicted enzyme related to lactoylglutathione lyase